MKFSFPSLTDIISRSKSTFQRFPVAMILSIVGTFSAIWLSTLSYSQELSYYWVLNLVFLCGLSISIFLGITTYGETRDWSKGKILGFKAIALIVLTGYYFTLPDGPMVEEPYLHIYRFVLFFLASHLWVAFAPFITNRDIGEFWGYNKVLFLNILTSALYSAALFLGLTIALLSLDVLLEFSIDGETYLQLFFFMVGIFNTWFFLARVPHPGDYEPEMIAYPKGLKVFVQYVLIPLVSVYIFILYLYVVKIIFQWELPQGWVANLVLTFSIAGILSLLLLYPIQHEEKHRWMRLYSKSYFYALIPLVILLYISIWTRISEYGVTINRFFVATLAVWLSGIVLYFIFSKVKNIKVIPISLCAVALLISVGPMSAFSVAERNQQGRIQDLLDANGLLDAEGMVMMANADISREDQEEISSAVHYLVNNHGLKSMAALFQEDLRTAMNSVKEDSLGYWSDEQKIMSLMGLDYIGPYGVAFRQEDYFSFSSNHTDKVPIEGYDFMIPQIYLDTYGTEMERDGYGIRFDQDALELVIRKGLVEGAPELRIPTRAFLNELIEHQNNSSGIPRERMTLTGGNEEFAVAIILNDISGEHTDELSVRSLGFHLLISEK